MQMSKMHDEKFRTESDSKGEVFIPATALWGAQTQRSLLNFSIGSEKMPPLLLEALLVIKAAAAKANVDAQKLSAEKAAAITQAVEKILAAQDFASFPLSVWQTGSGTQTNMNVNEVIAHLAKQEQVELHPNDEVNLSQSSNDVFPTAIHVAAYRGVVERLFPALDQLIASLAEKAAAYQTVIKVGRTHLQDATPVTFGQEISGWQAGLEHTKHMLELALTEIAQLPIGGTAVGTGLNAPENFAPLLIEHLNQWTQQPFVENPNKFHGLASKDATVFLSGALKALAANCMKMANDVRWLASGPRSGLGEITIPANEPGSSIMPGKVNPTQCEALTMVAVQVMGNDAAIGIAASQGNFELNVYMPLIAYNLIQSIDLLADALASFEEKCIAGLQINAAKMNQYVEQSLMLVTALNPHIGYDQGAKIVQRAFEEDLTLKQAALDSGLLSEAEYDQWIDPRKMIGSQQNEER